MAKKQCRQCGKTLSLDKFYKHPRMKDGHLNFCIECKKQEERGRYRENSKDQKWMAAERKRTRERNKRLGYWEKAKAKRTQAQRKRLNAISKEWVKRNPEKRKAHVETGNAIRSGKLKKQPCEVCGNENVEAHHNDYSKPLDVVWLCRKHHAELHRKD